jgi:hypothetical protein
VVSAIVAVIVLLVGTSSRGGAGGHFCPWPDDPSFSARGCADSSSPQRCNATANPGFEPDPAVCTYADPGACSGGLRPLRCRCLISLQCGFGLRCWLGSCTYKL